MPVDVTENAQIPWVTSDGIRLAYQSDLVDLDNFTNNFPMDLVGDAIESAVPGVGDVTIGNLHGIPITSCWHSRTGRRTEFHSFHARKHYPPELSLLL